MFIRDLFRYLIKKLWNIFLLGFVNRNHIVPQEYKSRPHVINGDEGMKYLYTALIRAGHLTMVIINRNTVWTKAKLKLHNARFQSQWITKQNVVDVYATFKLFRNMLRRTVIKNVSSSISQRNSYHTTVGTRADLISSLIQRDINSFILSRMFDCANGVNVSKI